MNNNCTEMEFYDVTIIQEWPFKIIIIKPLLLDAKWNQERGSMIGASSTLSKLIFV